MMVRIAIFVFIFDQLTKWSVLSMVEEGKVVNILGDFFKIHPLKNEGLVFGLLNNHPYLPLVIVSIILIGMLFCWRWIKDKEKKVKAGGGFIVGGAAGNLFDRLYQGGVIDFLDIGIRNLRWPVFNLADVSICIGVGILIYCLGKRRDG
jgi:signal peptidase II